MIKHINISLQPATETNWETIATFEKSAACKFFVPLTLENDIKKYIQHSKVFFIIFEGEKVGTVSYEIKTDNSIYFDGLTISPEYRGKGLGTLTIKTVLESLKEYKILNLVVHPKNNAALIVYLKAGFKIKEWKDNYFGDDEPRLFLEKINS